MKECFHSFNLIYLLNLILIQCTHVRCLLMFVCDQSVFARKNRPNLSSASLRARATSFCIISSVSVCCFRLPVTSSFYWFLLPSSHLVSRLRLVTPRLLLLSRAASGVQPWAPGPVAGVGPDPEEGLFLILS